MALAPGWYWRHRYDLERVLAMLAEYRPRRIGIDLSKLPEYGERVEFVVTPAGRFSFHDAFLASPLTEGDEDAKEAKKTAG
jgi:hypothetical protein